MDRASSLIFPGSRTLAGWWRQLLPYQPLALWIGYGFLHRIEATVSVLRDQPVDPLTHLVLQALALEPADVVSVESLQARLRLPGVVVQRVLIGMAGTGLLARSTSDRWQLTERGNHALQHRHVPSHVQERRNFPFLERTDATGQRVGAVQFFPVAECAGAPWQVDDAHRFDVTELQRCIALSPDQKQPFGFPLDVVALANGPDLEEWQAVIVDRPERVLLALIVAGSDKEMLGFAVKVEGWTLFDRVPIVRLPDPTSPLWPELAQPLPGSIWQEAWRSWCRQRQLPTNEVEICALNYHAPRLDVQAPGRLMQRLQAAKSDLFKGDAWLLVGEGYLRTAAQLAVRQS